MLGTPLYIQYPSWIHPQIFPNVPVLGLFRWYGLMYVFAVVTAFFVLKKQYKEGALDSPSRPATEDDIYNFIGWGFVGLILGARIFSTLVYNTSGIYWKKPWLIFWPFDPDTKQFTGLVGMSYHGGFIGGLLAMIIWCRVHKRPVWKWIDAMAVSIPLGFTFGRLGNFLNGELYGRVTTMPWGMIFRDAQTFSSSIDWVQEIMKKIGMEISETSRLVNLPRHPSQLYEAFFEGVFLWGILWLLRKRKPFDGFMAAAYTVCYGFMRFIIEYFREPDVDLGYRISANGSEVTALNTSLLNLSTGQILCFLMITGGFMLGFACWVETIKPKKQAAQKSLSGDSNDPTSR